MKRLTEWWKKAPEKSAENKPEMPERYPFTIWYTYGMHLYRRAGDDPTVEFVEEKSGRRKTIVDREGRIVGFPGIEKGDWVRALESEECLEPVIRFRTDFQKCGEGRYMMIWQVQPDGRYWADDDGFGMNAEAEVRLYAFLDRKGDFAGPFRIYNVGVRRYYQE